MCPYVLTIGRGVPGGHLMYNPFRKAFEKFSVPGYPGSDCSQCIFKTLETLVFCAHIPHGKQSDVEYTETMHEVSMCLDRFRAASLHHSIVTRVDANVSLTSFEDWRFVARNTPSVLSSYRRCRSTRRNFKTFCLLSTCEGTAPGQTCSVTT